jgi:polyhydroxybutyrate depolymerase
MINVCNRIKPTARDSALSRVVALMFASSLTLLAPNLVAAPFVRGDVDGGGTVEMTDAVQIFGYLYLGDPATIGCGDVADVDDNGVLEMADGIYILSHFFLGGPRPRPPYPRPGFDRTVNDPFPCGDVIGGPGRPIDLDVNGGLLHVPTSYREDTPMPLAFLLHGDPMTGRELESIANWTLLSEREGFLYAFPDGGVTGMYGSKLGWDITENGIDSTYLRRVIEDMKRHYNVDAGRVYIHGVSAGGHMAYRMACDHSDAVTAIFVNAGCMPEDVSTCNPETPVHVLHLHGVEDLSVQYCGGNVYRGVVQLSAEDSVRQWAVYNGCQVEPDERACKKFPPDADCFDFDASVTGDCETVVIPFAGCNPGGSAELWAVRGAGHVPRSGGRNPWLPWMLGKQKP